ncbi:hypothetical protein FQ330_03255 [Agrococcus sediminis]|uniref:Uncharacterized protein n=1 Tax=Agrococcus sediminis TaxID=2599924 RepID=A0A5M8QNY1_9MICO|nr:hypothetical protein [Agrococcus sediminis]KAA6436436.1 hypothetical protein FQ330_03255 [Agrococcus sediminis]
MGDTLRCGITERKVMSHSSQPTPRRSAQSRKARYETISTTVAAIEQSGAPAARLWELCTLPETSYEGRRYRYTAALSPRTPADLLAVLASSEGALIREAVAANPASSTTTLTQLAADEVQSVAVAVACNLSSGEDALRVLASDVRVTVRLFTAMRLDAPDDVVALLASDNSQDVRERAELAQYMYEGQLPSVERVRATITDNLGVTADTKAVLPAALQLPDTKGRFRVTKNDGATTVYLRRFSARKTAFTAVWTEDEKSGRVFRSPRAARVALDDAVFASHDYPIRSGSINCDPFAIVRDDGSSLRHYPRV